MNATILKVSKVPSKYGGDMFYIFFKGEDGKSYRTCVVPKYRNYKLWRPMCEKPEQAVGVICEGLQLKMNGHVDADFLTKTRIAPKLKEALK